MMRAEGHSFGRRLDLRLGPDFAFSCYPTQLLALWRITLEGRFVTQRSHSPKQWT